MAGLGYSVWAGIQNFLKKGGKKKNQASSRNMIISFIKKFSQRKFSLDEADTNGA